MALQEDDLVNFTSDYKKAKQGDQGYVERVRGMFKDIADVKLKDGTPVDGVPIGKLKVKKQKK